MFKKISYPRLKTLLSTALVVLMFLFFIKQIFFTDYDAVTEGVHYEYVGRESCIECHKAEYEDWLGSHHDLAMNYATDSSVLGDFNDASFVREGQVHRCFKRNGEFWVLTDGEDGSMQEYQVKYVFGFTPLQNYLVEFPGGRLQTLALTWDSQDSCWFYMSDKVYAEEQVDHTNWLHWTNQAQNWNSMCAYCHSTNLQLNYDVEADAYHTTWSEIDVSCEACHGPASKHLEWAELPEYARKDWENYGLVTQTSGIDHEAFVALCTRCHSRRVVFNDYDPYQKNMFDHLVPELPIAPNYHIDGQIKEEDYVYGSFTHSKMYMNGVQCNDCHNVHSGKLILEGNALCLQCHKAADYDIYNHHFHQVAGGDGESVVSAYGDTYEVGSGAQCINCHMPAQYYMGVDLRNDHSFRIPRPDLSDKLGSPNACTQCHGDKSNAWAAEHVEKWHGKNRRTQFGEVFHAVEEGCSSDSALWSIIDDEVYPESVRAAAIGYLDAEKPENRQRLRSYLHSLIPELRIAALRAYPLLDGDDVSNVLPLLRNELMVVRMEAALKLSALPSDGISAKDSASFHAALEEYADVQRYNADFPVGKFNLGNYYMIKKDYANAERFFLAALDQDEALDVVRLQLAYLYNLSGRLDDAVGSFKSYLERVGDDAVVIYDLALLLSEIANVNLTRRSEELNKQRQSISEEEVQEIYAEALHYLQKVLDLAPEHPRAAYNIAMIYQFLQNKGKAETYLLKHVEVNAHDADAYVSLLNFYIQVQEKSKAKEVAKKVVELFPNHPNSQELKAFVLQ